MYFSQLTRGFYIETQDRPSDALPITDAEHAAFLDALNNGGRVENIGGHLVAVPYAASFEDQRAVKIAAINQLLRAKLAEGYVLSNGLHISITGDVERRMTSMGTTAGFAVLGISAWPEEYQRGWITEENIRFPLPAPTDGVALATAVGAYTAALIQHARDLKDTVVAAANAADLEEIDITAGWAWQNET